MRKTLGTLIICLLCITLNAPVAQAAGDTDTIRLVPIDFARLKTETDPGAITKILFPSGMKLPTNLLDVVDLAPLSFEVEVEGNPAASFLVQQYPEAKGEFTFAEYKSASAFVNLNALLSRDTPDGVVESAMEGLDWALQGYISSAELTSPEGINQLCTQYESLLTTFAQVDSPIENHEDYIRFSSKTVGGFYLTFGASFDWSILTESAEKDLAQDVAERFRTRNEYWSTVGIAQEPLDLESSSLLEGVLAQPVLPAESPTEEPIEEPAEEAPSYVPEVTESPAETTSSGIPEPDDSAWDTPYELGKLEPPNGTSKQYGTRDVLSWVALVFVVITLAVLWVVTTIQRKKDPLWKYLGKR